VSSLITSLLATRLVRVPRNQQLQYLRLALGEAEVCTGPETHQRSGVQRRSATRPAQRMIDDGLALADPTQVPDQLLSVDALEDVTGSTDPQRLEEVVLVVVHRQKGRLWCPDAAS